MGLSSASMGKNAVDMGFCVKKISDDDKVIALAGNPNVGKSSVFNQLTGLRQHTGNWPGKTVSNAQGICSHNGKNYILVDIPGTYSLMAHSKEEEVARDFILFGNPDAVIVVCDATCLERNLNLVLQTIEITTNVIVCVNLMDEARKRNISVDLKKLSDKLGVPVVGTVARKGKGLKQLMDTLDVSLTSEKAYQIRYLAPIEEALSILTPILKKRLTKTSPRFAGLRLLENDTEIIDKISEYEGFDISGGEEISSALNEAALILADAGITRDTLSDKIVSCIVLGAEDICNGSVFYDSTKYREADRRIDKVLTSRVFGFPLMILLLGFVFWLTIWGANIPSEILSHWFFLLQEKLLELCIWSGVPEAIYSPLIFGVYNVLTRVVAVMLPPMAVFFPLFTFLEDLGYLPRIAFNLDKAFKKCSACGKQALTMCMGFGCNAAGIVGCRIIDSPRERLIAILTNSFVPCNGRFPTLISVITMFFVFSSSGITESILGAVLLTSVVLLGIIVTFGVSKLLSKTILKGQPSSFTLELPPYRRPDIGKIIIRSIFDRTLFVLMRAVTVAAPCGLLIWIFANVYIGDMTLLSHAAAFLDPFARIIGLDGTILFSFILGFPANEIVMPLIIMAYMSQGTISDTLSLLEMKELFVANGWTFVTAVNVMLFSLMHWPCSTTMLTIKKETGSLKWTFLAFLIPTLTGILACFLFTSFARLF